MLKNLQQNVVQRRRPVSVSHDGVGGRWHTRQREYTRGSINSSTLTIMFALVALMSIASLGFFYLQQVFGTASKGADIQSLESKMVELREEHRALELEGAQLRSIQAVEDRVMHLNLAPTDHVAYLAPVPEGKVALSRP